MQKLKILFFIMVFFSALAVPSFALPFVDDLYANIKEQTTKGLEASFNRKVKIKKISGRIIGEVLLEGVSIGDEVHLESLKVEFNPIRSEEHTSELQSLTNLVCRLLLEK